MPDTHELAWAAGFFDGEGHMATHPYKRVGARNSHRIAFSIAQTDPEPLLRFQAALGGIGIVLGPYASPKRPTYAPIWRYQIHRWREAQAAVAMLWRFLSGPKRQQTSEALRKYHDGSHKLGRYPGRNTWCKRGLHRMTADNLYVDTHGGHRCRTCRKKARAEWYARKHATA